MKIANDKLPESATAGFYICTNRHYNQWVAVAPIRETAKTLLCCEVIEKKIKVEDFHGDEKITYAPGDEFARGCQGFAWVYTVKKSDMRAGNFKTEREWIRDRWA